MQGQEELGRTIGRVLQVNLTEIGDAIARFKPLILQRFYYAGTEGEVIASELHGFCDASAKAYGAVVFLRIVTTCASYVRFLSSKTRVVPLSEQTMPRLELLSAVSPVQTDPLHKGST